MTETMPPLPVADLLVFKWRTDRPASTLKQFDSDLRQARHILDFADAAPPEHHTNMTLARARRDLERWRRSHPDRLPID